jgi:mannose-6-phosphate isomerase-like protein (cupin superfamily)
MAVTANITSFPSADGDEKDIFFSFSLSKHSTWRNDAANSRENRRPRFPVLPSMATNKTHYEQMMNGTSNASRRIITAASAAAGSGERKAMETPKVGPISQMRVQIRQYGSSEFIPGRSGQTEKRGDVIAWDPLIEGVLCGECTMDQSADHRGERHLDGDEVLYLVSGSIRVVLMDGVDTIGVPVRTGEAILVPCQVWHRIVVDEPAKFLFIGGGRTEIRLA